MDGDERGELLVLRCDSCGDTFTAHRGEVGVECPSCGDTEHQLANEPLL